LASTLGADRAAARRAYDAGLAAYDRLCVARSRRRSGRAPHQRALRRRDRGRARPQRLEVTDGRERAALAITPDPRADVVVEAAAGVVLSGFTDFGGSSIELSVGARHGSAGALVTGTF